MRKKLSGICVCTKINKKLSQNFKVTVKLFHEHLIIMLTRLYNKSQLRNNSVIPKANIINMIYLSY